MNEQSRAVTPWCVRNTTRFPLLTCQVIGEEEGDKVWGSLLTWGASEVGFLENKGETSTADDVWKDGALVRLWLG